MKRLRLIPALLSLSLVACTTAAPPSGDGPLKIGYIGPLTGEASPYGVDTLNGVKLAVTEINAAGGVNGQEIQLIAEDGKCTGTEAAGAAQKLVHIDKVVAIIGGQCSGETLAAAPIAEAAKVVMISSLSSSPDVTTAGDFIFRDYPSDALKTKAMSNYLAEEGLSNVVTITENTDFAVAFRDSLAANLGGDDPFVLEETVEPNTKDFRSIITRLEDLEFDVFFPNGQTSATIGAMMQQLREQGYEQLAVSHDVAQDASLLEIAPEATAGMQAIGVPDVSSDSAFGKKFLETFSETQASLAFAAHAYDAANLLAEAIGAVGTEGEALRDYLYAHKGYEGVVGRFKFDDNGDVVGIPYVLYEAVDGVWTAKQDIAVD